MRGRGSRLTRAGVAACWCALLMLAGCSESGPSLGKLVPVQGKIMMADGKPLPSGLVTFILIDRDLSVPTPAPEGNIEEDGSYTLSTNGKPGAPPGKYRVVLNPGSDWRIRSAVPSQYFSQRKSPLEVEIVENKPAGGYDLKLQFR